MGLIAAYFVRSPSDSESVEKTSHQSFKEALAEALKLKVIFYLYQDFLFVVFILLWLELMFLSMLLTEV